MGRPRAGESERSLSGGRRERSPLLSAGVEGVQGGTGRRCTSHPTCRWTASARFVAVWLAGMPACTRSPRTWRMLCARPDLAQSGHAASNGRFAARQFKMSSSSACACFTRPSRARSTRCSAASSQYSAASDSRAVRAPTSARSSATLSGASALTRPEPSPGTGSNAGPWRTMGASPMALQQSTDRASIRFSFLRPSQVISPWSNLRPASKNGGALGGCR